MKKNLKRKVKEEGKSHPHHILVIKTLSIVDINVLQKFNIGLSQQEERKKQRKKVKIKNSRCRSRCNFHLEVTQVNLFN